MNPEAEEIDVRQDPDGLRREIEDLRAARRRLVEAADGDRRTIERALHDGVHQQLVALAVKLQLVEGAVRAEPAQTAKLLEELRRDVQEALDETALLAQRIYPPTLEASSLGPLLRSTAATAGVPASVDIAAGSTFPPEVAVTVYLCWLDALARWRGDGRVTVTAHESEGALAFDVVTKAAPPEAEVDHLRDRVAALGGRLAIAQSDDGGIRLFASLPLAR